MSTTINQDYINPRQQVEDEIDQPTKEEKKLNKKIEKKAAKNFALNNYAVVRKTSRWLIFKRWAITFFILSIVFILVFVLMKYLNYYFNFGPMDQETALRIGTVNWIEPFNKWSWSITNDFANILVDFQYPDEAGNLVNIQQVVVEGVQWVTSGGTGTLAISVSREAFITNNIANGMLYLAAPISLVLGFLFLLLHYLFGKIRAKAIINKYITLIQAESYKLGQTAGETKRMNSSTVETHTTTTTPTPVVINVVNGQPNQPKMAESELVVDKEQINQQSKSDSQKSMTTTTTQVTKTVKPTKTESASTANSKVTKTTTHVHQLQPNISVEEHVWAKAAPLPKITKKRKSYPTLGKNDLINEIYNDLKGTLTIKQLGSIYDLTFTSIIDELDKEPTQDINIFNFGKFNSIIKPGHTGINPATREKIWIEDKTQLKFAPSLKFKKIMEETEEQLTTKTVTTVKTKKG